MCVAICGRTTTTPKCQSLQTGTRARCRRCQFETGKVCKAPPTTTTHRICIPWVGKCVVWPAPSRDAGRKHEDAGTDAGRNREVQERLARDDPEHSARFFGEHVEAASSSSGREHVQQDLVQKDASKLLPKAETPQSVCLKPRRCNASGHDAAMQMSKAEAQ